MKNPRFLLGLATLLVTVAVGAGPGGPVGLGRAQAQAQAQGFAIDRFEPAERGSDFFVLDSLDFRDKHLSLGVVGDYGYKPLVFYDVNGDPAQALVEHQLFLHLGMSFVLGERLRLAANLPVAALVSGNGGTIGTTQYTVDGGGLGDLRLSADLRLVGEYRGPFSMAFGGSVWLPTGDRGAYTGDGKARIAPHVMLAGDLGSFVYALKLAVNVRFQDEPLAGAETGSEVFAAVSMGVRAGKNVLIGPELYTSTVVKATAFSEEGTPAELLFGAHFCIADAVRFGLGAGPGLNHAFGSPELRGAAKLEWDECAPDEPPPPPPPASTPVPAPRDRDGDGVIDRFDACPDVPGVVTDDRRTNGCPEPEKDRDHDRILDEDDACPDEPGRPTNDPTTNGCPERDRDHDGILDKDDACPDVAGLLRDAADENGCPDTDGDDIVDPKDACPEVAGPPNEDPKKHGCPIARIEQGQIRILEQVKFRTNSAEILAESNTVLEAVRDILEQHAKITKVAIEGHTDNVGKPKYNKKLSDRRAASVMKWLVRNGIGKERLTSAGFGLERPLASNDSEEGRRENRRVEFHIREIDGKPASEADVAREAKQGGEADESSKADEPSEADDSPESQESNGPSEPKNAPRKPEAEPSDGLQELGL